MPRFVHRTTMPVSRAALFAWHERDGAFERLAPPWAPVRVLESSGGIRDGGRVVLRVPVGPAHVRWELEHRDYREGEQFRDVQLHGPFEHWDHWHRFEDGPDGTSVLHDEIDYALPAGAIGEALAGGFIAGDIARLFRYRHALTAGDLARHAQFAHKPRLTVAITGATGMIGSALAAFLTTGGHTVRRIGRGAPRPGSSDIQWDPSREVLDRRALEGIDAVVHLAGANLAEKWTHAHEHAIRDSRVEGTRLLARTLPQLEHQPSVFVSASAIGAYGERGSDELDETSPSGTTWLASVTRDWEGAADAARAAGIRVVHPRLGIVLSARGGVLGKLLPIFRLGGGGKVGAGAHWVSWVALDDALGGLHWMLQRGDATGPINLTAPTPVTNAEFTKVLGKVLHRPAVATVPAFVLRLVYGDEMTREVLIGSQRVLPKVLERAGFEFRHRTLEQTLRFEVGLV